MVQEISDPPSVRILLVDDHPIVREALAVRIASRTDMVICGVAEGAQSAYQLATVLKPDIIIVDISLKDGDGISLIKRLRAENATVPILVWSMHLVNLYAATSMRAGDNGFVSKLRADDNFDPIREVMAGRTYISVEAGN